MIRVTKIFDSEENSLVSFFLLDYKYYWSNKSCAGRKRCNLDIEVYNDCTGSYNIYKYSELKELIDLSKKTKVHGIFRLDDLYYVSPWSAEAVSVLDDIEYVDFCKLSSFSDKYGDVKQVTRKVDELLNSDIDFIRIGYSMNEDGEYYMYPCLSRASVWVRAGEPIYINFAVGFGDIWKRSNTIDYMLHNSNQIIWLSDNMLGVLRSISEPSEIGEVGVTVGTDYGISIFRYTPKFLKAVFICSG